MSMVHRNHKDHTRSGIVNYYNLTECALRQGDIPPGIAVSNYVELPRITITLWRNCNE